MLLLKPCQKVLIALSATSGGAFIVSFVSVIDASVGITNASFSLVISLATGIIKTLLNITRNKKKKHNKIFMLIKSKLNIIKTLTSQTLIDLEISHEEFKAVVNEKKYEKKKRIRMMKSSAELKENSGNIRKKNANA